MNIGRCALSAGAGASLAVVITAMPFAVDADGKGTPGPHKHDQSAAHIHAPVPPEYEEITAPPGIWIDRAAIARGQSIYAAKCAVCHGAAGAGDGPAAASLRF